MKSLYPITRILALAIAVWFTALNANGQNPDMCDPPTLTCSGNILTNNSTGICGAEVTYPAPGITTNCPCTTPETIPGYTSLGVFNNHRYFLSDASLDWQAARNAAISAGGHLVSITSAGENTFVAEAAQIAGASVWIGLNDEMAEGTFIWSDGETVGFTNWWPGEPNNASGIEHYTEIYNNGRWNDLPGFVQKRFVVEFNCTGLTMLAGLPSGSIFPVGTTTNSYSYTDSFGQTTTCTFDVIVSDVTPPVITCPGDMTFHCQPEITYTIPTYQDNCGGIAHDYILSNCTYSSFDMSGATPIGNCDDCLFGPFTLPFGFKFYGDLKSSVYVSTNGFVSFDTPPGVGQGCCQGQSIPNSNFQNSIAVGWTDWVATTSYKVFGTAPNRIFVVYWSGFEFYTYPQVRMQLALYEGTSEIRIITEQSDPVVGSFHVKTMGLSHDGTIAKAVPGRNSQHWSAYNECISFFPENRAELISGIPSGGIFPVGTTAITYSATDESGNTSTCSFNITYEPYMTGTVTVGTGGNFATLTGEDGLFDFINSNGICEQITALIISDITEPGTIALNEISTGNPDPSAVLVIRPDAYVDRYLTGNVPQAMIRFNGADYVTIDGGDGGYYSTFLHLKNTDPAQPVLSMTNGATHNQIRSCTIEGSNSNPSSGLVVLETSTAPDGNSDNVFYGNTFDKSAESAVLPVNQFYSSGSPAAPNKGNLCQFNRFTNFDQSGVVVTASGNGSDWSFLNNSFYFPPTPHADGSKTFISFIPGSSSINNVIAANFFGGTSMWSVGSAWDCTGTGTMKIISVHAGAISVNGNYIDNMRFSNPGNLHFTGIEILNGAAFVNSNYFNKYPGFPTTISSAGTGTFIAINSVSTTTVDLSQNEISEFTFTKSTGSPIFKGIQMKKGNAFSNRIYNITATQQNLTPTFYGIANVGTGLTSPNQIYNNQVSITAGISTKPRVYGLFDQSIGIGADFYHNTVLLSGVTTIGYSTSAFYRIGNGVVNIYNNILANTRISNSIAKHYAININSSSFWTSNYNDLYTASASLGMWGSSNFNTFSAWKMFTGQDANSINVAPVFVSPVDLHLVPVSNAGIDNKGTPMFSTSYDIDWDSRNPSTPDMGVDEFGSAPPRIEPENGSNASLEFQTENQLKIYPNPFATNSNIEVVLILDDRIQIEVYNLLGDKIQTIAEGNYTAGNYSFTFDAGEIPAGTYVCRFIIDGKESIVKRMEIVK